jgi:3-(3-hydroxy-phenyl)propionate hydroxylase
MDKDYQKLVFDYVRPAAGTTGSTTHWPVIVVGAGPVGLSVAIDLARQGVRTLLVDDDNTLSAGSRAICFAKRTLEIWDRLGCGDRLVEKGVRWNAGKVFFRDELVYSFDLLAESGHERPAFINLQQYYAEGFLHERASELEHLEIRWKNKVVAVRQDPARVELTVQTPDGTARQSCDFLIACDGSRSPTRRFLGLQTAGQTFRDRFLIADVKMKAPFPAERWFWFDPPFHRGHSVLLHMQPDGVWRIDFQLGWDADPVAERDPARVAARVRALLGDDAQFEFEWVSIYTFACLRMDKFRHGRVLFAGDAAHGVSPFGARGANSGVQDADNLAWKLRLVLSGRAPSTLLDTYDVERVFAADENILHSTRSTDFITPKSNMSRIFRDATLMLSRDYPFARRLVNSGRLSVPSTLRDSTLNTPDEGIFGGVMVPGAPCADAPVATDHGTGWLLRQTGDEFTGIYFRGEALPPGILEDIGALARDAIPVQIVIVYASGRRLAEPLSNVVVVEDTDGLAAVRFDARPGTFYLLRPDQHVCARWRTFDLPRVRSAVARATCNA